MEIHQKNADSLSLTHFQSNFFRHFYAATLRCALFGGKTKTEYQRCCSLLCHTLFWWGVNFTVELKYLPITFFQLSLLRVILDDGNPQRNPEKQNKKNIVIRI
jgi:hypothetical protein